MCLLLTILNLHLAQIKASRDSTRPFAETQLLKMCKITRITATNAVEQLQITENEGVCQRNRYFYTVYQRSTEKNTFLPFPTPDVFFSFPKTTEIYHLAPAFR